MVNISLIEKIKMIISLFNNQETKYILPIILGITLLLIVICLVKRKYIKHVYMIFYITIIGILMYLYHEPILKFFDYLIENIVNNILFPNIAVYSIILLTVNIGVILSILKNNIKSYIKTINVICFSVIHLLLFFIVRIILENNINVYEKLTVYSNQELLVLIEVSMIVFVFWILVLTTISLIKSIIKKVNKVEITNIISELDNNLEYIEPNNQNQMVLTYSKEETQELIEYVPIKKKEFRTSK